MLTVDHDGNSTDSPEEAAAIVAEIERLLGAAWTDEHGTAPLGQADVLVVAPYNAQVVTAAASASTRPDSTTSGSARSTSSRARQAPVVIVSMTASSADDVPRGMAFLLNRNRLNVAVCRAK